MMMQGPMPTPGPAPMRGPPSGPQKPTKEAVFALFKNPIGRRFKIDIENDSTIAGDESQERQDRTQFIESVTKFIEAWGPMTMQMPTLIPLAGKMLLFGVRAFKVGRELEEEIETTVDKMEQSPPQSQGQGKQAEEQVKLQGTQAKAKAEIAKSQIDGQVAQQSGQAKMAGIQLDSQAKQQEMALKMQMEQQRHQAKMAELQMEHEKTMAKAAVDQQARKEQAAQAALKPVGKQQGGAQNANPPKWPVNEPGF